MKYELPQLLPECEQDDKAFCALCRDKAKGAYTRKTLLRVRGVPGVSINFECPKGKPWANLEPQSKAKPLTKTKSVGKSGGCNCSRAKRNPK